MAKFVMTADFKTDKTSERLEVRPRHRDYLRKLLDDGKLFGSGPWMDDSGACIVYEAADEDEARALLAADPYTEAEVLQGITIKEWNPVLHSW